MLTLLDARVFALEIDIGRHGVRANWAVGLSLGVVFNECFHVSLHFIRRKILSTGCSNFVKILKC
jgi:hypothetical protein